VRNVILFIRKYANFFFFLLFANNRTQFLFQYNKYHEAAWMNVPANQQALSISGTAKWKYYFRLKKINEQLAGGKHPAESDA